MLKSRITITISFILSTFYTYDNVVATLWNVVFFLGTLLDKRTVAEMRLEMPNELKKTISLINYAHGLYHLLIWLGIQ